MRLRAFWISGWTGRASTVGLEVHQYHMVWTRNNNNRNEQNAHRHIRKVLKHVSRPPPIITITISTTTECIRHYIVMKFEWIARQTVLRHTAFSAFRFSRARAIIAPEMRWSDSESLSSSKKKNPDINAQNTLFYVLLCLRICTNKQNQNVHEQATDEATAKTNVQNSERAGNRNARVRVFLLLFLWRSIFYDIYTWFLNAVLYPMSETSNVRIVFTITISQNASELLLLMLPSPPSSRPLEHSSAIARRRTDAIQHHFAVHTINLWQIRFAVIYHSMRSIRFSDESPPQHRSQSDTETAEATRKYVLKSHKIQWNETDEKEKDRNAMKNKGISFGADGHYAYFHRPWITIWFLYLLNFYHSHSPKPKWTETIKCLIFISSYIATNAGTRFADVPHFCQSPSRSFQMLSARSTQSIFS